jgi:hypothetical protein
MRIPASGGTLDWVATVHIPGLNGQGIAWDRTDEGNKLWGILKEDEEVYRIQMPQIVLPKTEAIGVLRGPGEFAQ